MYQESHKIQGDGENSFNKRSVQRPVGVEDSSKKDRPKGVRMGKFWSTWKPIRSWPRRHHMPLLRRSHGLRLRGPNREGNLLPWISGAAFCRAPPHTSQQWLHLACWRQKSSTCRPQWCRHELEHYVDGRRICCVAVHVVMDVYMGVSKNYGTPKSSILIVFFIIFTIHFGGKKHIFGSTPIYSHKNSCRWGLGRVSIKVGAVVGNFNERIKEASILNTYHPCMVYLPIHLVVFDGKIL